MIELLAILALLIPGYQVQCEQTYTEHGYLGWFDWRESDPPVVELDRPRVCRPLKRKLERGFPNTEKRQEALGAAIFIVAHERYHARQWTRGLPLNESEADNYAATHFRRYARQAAHMTNPKRKTILIKLIRPWVGYNPPLIFGRSNERVSD